MDPTGRGDPKDRAQELMDELRDLDDGTVDLKGWVRDSLTNEPSITAAEIRERIRGADEDHRRDVAGETWIE